MSTKIRKKHTGEPGNGGQFGHTQRGESSFSLSDESLGDVTNIQPGSRTPWGSAQHVEHLDDGIAGVSCAGHGGFKLSPERNALVPKPLRNQSGWYEEDCEANIVAMTFPSAFERGSRSRDEIEADAERAVKDYYPDQYEEAFGVPVGEHESFTRRRQAAERDAEAFRAAHANEFVSTTAHSGVGDLDSGWVPKGQSLIEARRDADGEVRSFLVPDSEAYANNARVKNILIDPDRHLDVTDVVAQRPDRPWAYEPEVGPLLHGDELGIDTDGLTPSARSRADRELNKVYRFQDDDGSTKIESLAEHMERVGVVGKAPAAYDGKTVEYRVEYADNRVSKVSKATYDALTGVPDTSSESERAHHDVIRANAAVERAKNNYWNRPSEGMEKVRKAEAKRDAALAVREAARKKQDAEAQAWKEEARQMRQEAFDKLNREQGLSF